MAYNPKSLDNLKVISTSEHANAMREKGLKTRRERKAALEDLKLSAKQIEEVGSLTLMRGLLAQAIDEGDTESIYKYTKELAEYEQPKLTRKESTTVNLDASQMTDEQLQEALKNIK